ncbi:histidine phosphatase family protein [Bacillus sp. RG28]|uniref:Histidine phosphatase family protein n=1 Tax=Gottfriedia endophytica TaxID=2820819 RepID=A0A940NSG3_9BACI|nr:histidine phosphatase family protein [Gottfriedia endophytica]MBP0725981.1 histidine phosphatase family protein [Gottfriedia endophytica]
MITNLYFVRHAHSTYTPDELGRPLSERGFSDAKIVAELLSKEKIDYVVSSPYKRTIQTVEEVAKSLKQEIIIEEKFKERVLSKEPVEDFNHVISEVWKDFNLSWDGGESNITAQKRGIEAMNNILKNYCGKNVVIGTHGNIMVLIMNFFDQKYDYDFWNELAMPDIYKLTFEGDALTKVNRIWN